MPDTVWQWHWPYSKCTKSILIRLKWTKSGYCRYESRLNLIENRLSSILLNDIEVSPALVHPIRLSLTNKERERDTGFWITMKVPYVTHCWRCDTFYKTSFGIGTAIINLSPLFSHSVFLSFFCVFKCVGVHIAPMDSNIIYIFTNASIWEFSWCITLVTHIFGFLIFAICYIFFRRTFIVGVKVREQSKERKRNRKRFCSSIWNQWIFFCSMCTSLWVCV